MGNFFLTMLLSFSLQTLGDKEEGAATVKLGQREGGVLEWSMLGFGGVSSEFELVRYSYDDECMHDAKC
jgi:hypothetical protein